jgi:hypothetical protein
MVDSMVYEQICANFTQILNFLKTHTFLFFIDDEAELMHITCLVYGDYETLHYILYSLTRLLERLKTP